MKIRTKPVSERPDGTTTAPYRRSGFAVATAAVALLAAACGAADETAEAPAGDGAAPDTAVQDGPRLDASLFSGEAQTVGGETFDLGSLANKDLVLWFWAPW